jgi:hypothetical protein
MLSLVFVFKKVILLNFAVFTLPMYFWVRYTAWLHGQVPWEGGVDIGVHRSSSI